MLQEPKPDATSTTALSKLSVVIPVYNEEESIPILFDRLITVLDRLPHAFEIVAVDDGSTDRSVARLTDCARKRSEFKVVEFRRNYGQTAALMAGIDHSSGDVIVTIDADLQNDPEDIPILLERLESGADVVSGWRKNRQDAAVRRTFVSRVANRLISTVSGVKLNDYGCTLKAYRRDVLQGVRLYGEMHRFVPIYASWMGAKVVEEPVRHHGRRFGTSKYGLERTLKVLLDLMVVKFFARYLVKPIYVFGGFGVLALVASFLSASYMLYLKVAHDVAMVATPLPIFVAMLFIVGIMTLLMGILAEILVRIYFESSGQTPYSVLRTTNMDEKT